MLDGKLYVNGKEYKEDGSMKAAFTPINGFLYAAVFSPWYSVCLHSQKKDKTITDRVFSVAMSWKKRFKRGIKL